MRKILVVLLLLQVAPSFADKYHAGYDNVCAKYGCTIPPVSISVDRLEMILH